MAKLLLGPLLSLNNENEYCISFLAEKGLAENNVKVKVGSSIMDAKLFSSIITGDFYVAKFNQVQGNESILIQYSILINNAQAVDKFEKNAWSFTIPSSQEEPLIAYASCNGFSTYKLMKNTEKPFALWNTLMTSHKKNPFALLIMGGDQVYADEIWTEVKLLQHWSGLTYEEQISKPIPLTLSQKLDEFYENLYIKRWSQKDVAEAMASIPTIMMWDDHDIFDGWGSYPTEMQECDYYKAIFASAKKYFSIFQLRGRPLFSDKQNHFAFALNYSKFSILAMDHRSQRTRTEIISKEQWQSTIDWLKEVKLNENLLVLSGVPLVYRDFGGVENFLNTTPWTEELTDDVNDHWRARSHQGERLRLVNQLLSELKVRTDRYNQTHDKNQWLSSSSARTVILSGDVHVGALGVILDKRGDKAQKIHQIVSSGIVHPAPSLWQWMAITLSTNDKTEFLNEDKTIEATMIAPAGTEKYIRARNFATLKIGNDNKLWINWINESKDLAEYPLE